MMDFLKTVLLIRVRLLCLVSCRHLSSKEF